VTSCLRGILSLFEIFGNNKTSTNEVIFMKILNIFCVLSALVVELIFNLKLYEQIWKITEIK